MMYWF